jgi:transposase InsO family protein
MDTVKQQSRPLGLAGQRPLRRLEARARTAALALGRWGKAHGHSARAIARRIGIAPQTLLDWQHRRSVGQLGGSSRGRPSQPLSASLAGEVREVIEQCRGRMGVPSLKAAFIEVPRAALADLCRQYRLEQKQSMEHLAWSRPGSVWAADFTQALVPVDGIYPHVLSIRDLASGYQLLAWPVRWAQAAVTVAALRCLFAAHALPLVLKSDNGSHFTDATVRRLLEEAKVIHLLSPPRTPWYNGANEAGIGSLKTRTLAIAATFGRPEAWTSDDVEAARVEANEQARPWGRTGPVPTELWEARSPILDQERNAFIAAVRQSIAHDSHAFIESIQEESLQEKPGCRPATPLTARQRASVARSAIRRVLVEHGYLLVRRNVI